MQSHNLSEVRAIAKEAYIYGFPMVDSYRIQYAYNIRLILGITKR